MLCLLVEEVEILDHMTSSFSLSSYVDFSKSVQEQSTRIFCTVAQQLVTHSF